MDALEGCGDILGYSLHGGWKSGFESIKEVAGDDNNNYEDKFVKKRRITSSYYGLSCEIHYTLTHNILHVRWEGLY